VFLISMRNRQRRRNSHQCKTQKRFPSHSLPPVFLGAGPQKQFISL
jgi:hypothetical protein